MRIRSKPAMIIDKSTEPKNFFSTIIWHNRTQARTQQRQPVINRKILHLKIIVFHMEILNHKGNFLPGKYLTDEAEFFFKQEWQKLLARSYIQPCLWCTLKKFNLENTVEGRYSWWNLVFRYTCLFMYFSLVWPPEVCCRMLGGWGVAAIIKHTVDISKPSYVGDWPCFSGVKSV
jgi:hypothetical protein